MLKDLTKLKWKKNIYYVSDGVIFEISPRKKNSDLDDCGTYLIDLEKASDKVKNAKDGSLIDLKDDVEAFAENVPYIRLTFISPKGGEINKIFPLQHLIEEGDMVVDGKAVQKHPNVFDGKYHNKFNQEVFDFIIKTLKGKKDFDKKNVDAVMKALPNWLTMDIEFKYMTEKYIDNYFLKGMPYNNKIATSGAKSDDDVFQYRGAVIGIGIDPLDGEYVPINIWQKETVESLLKALYAENTVNKYNECVRTELNSLSVDSMEKMAEAIKDVEMGFNKKNLRTFLNAEYRDHDCDGVKFESVCAADDIDTWYEYESRKDDSPTIVFEEVIAEDKAFVERYIKDNFGDGDDTSKYWWESEFTLDSNFTDDVKENKIESVINVFTVASDSRMEKVVLLIYHEGGSSAVAEYKGATFVGDNDLYAREGEIVKTLDEAYSLMMASDFEKPQSRQCTLRAALGPQGATTPPQYIFGNIHYQLYVNAETGEVLNYNPAFPPEEGGKLIGTAEDIRASHKQLVNNNYGKNDWCTSQGSFMEFMDDANFDIAELYEVEDFFKAEDGTYVSVYENEDGEELTEVEGTFGVMPNVEIVTLADAANAVLEKGIAPHSEHWMLFSDGETIKYKFGNDVFVDAVSGEVIE